MKRIQCLWAAAFAGILLSPVARGQDVFTLGFEGSDGISGGEGQKKTEVYYATVKHEGPGFNAQGWSYGVSSEGNALIVSLTTLGTTADKVENGGLWNSGFNKTETIDPAKNAGKTGAVSGVVLSLTEGTTLAKNTTSRIGKMDVELTIPVGGGEAKLVYLGGLKGSGQPVQIVITQEGDSKSAITIAKPIALTPAVNCCGTDVVVGFSGSVIRGADAEDSGLVGLGTDCLASGGTIDVFSNLGVVGEKVVYANVSNNLVDPEGKKGVQGWSFSVQVDGTAALTSVTTAGTAADKDSNGGLWNSGFNKTELTDPAKNPEGVRGGTSGVVLSLTEGTILPLGGTESVLAFHLKADAAQGEDPQTTVLKFRDGLRGSGQPVNNVITVDGDSKAACNFKSASVNVSFKKSEVAPERSFIRGNSNNDAKVDIADSIWIINQLFRQGPVATCADALDVNDDGSADATDAVALINYLFKGQAPPSAPFPSCGTDTTEDTLTCEVEQDAC